MISIWLLIFTFSSVAAFSSPPTTFAGRKTIALVSPTPAYMFSADSETPKPLDVSTEENGAVSTTSEADTDITLSGGMIVKNLAPNKAGEVRETKFVDEAMMANTDPSLVNWWAYVIVGLPALLLADDVFHFLPEDGVFAFLQNI
mmetsp:Transcript_23404/g.34686  ORF Transcript_23404/g.34686 Transcript_23404/m.34686 type:complete len:145 (-) Transcript_23404:69-503(-)|eukprot:CAMPEP_0194048714 /NCGR_PEP_ID=MMETSP0009_2-20130614/28246_1 /TAXON_ID=210454 /ORGANISM="Grammatophora oceanica, Strain CCMP 410" /LENGTH=144 /DNA_ID=CAMNT_0038694665 /DNA_START=200 /DNA_END=634 /DNA_ORIENTATION=+